MQGTNDLRFALELARAAAQEIVPRFQRYFGSRTTVTTKKDGSVVTEADLAAERVMRRMISERYSGDGILGEEEGVSPGSRDRTWVIDPIDGTSSFSLGLAEFGTLVALMEGRTPVLGVIHFPVASESIYAETGGGCWRVGESGEAEQVRVDDSVTRLTDASISVSHVEGSELRGSLANWRSARLISAARQLYFIGDCVQYGVLVRGHIHAALDAVMQPWDVAALLPCIYEAGGVASTVDGNCVDLVFGGSLLASSSRTLHDEILSAIRR